MSPQRNSGLALGTSHTTGEIPGTSSSQSQRGRLHPELEQRHLALTCAVLCLTSSLPSAVLHIGTNAQTLQAPAPVLDPYLFVPLLQSQCRWHGIEEW